MKEILESIILNIVANKEQVYVTETIEETAIIYEVKVAEEDIGRIIGKQGKVAQAIRTLIKSIGAKEKKKIVVKFVG
ncbi:MAG: KH domain-containing protein [Clostridia bacterium]